MDTRQNPPPADTPSLTRWRRLLREALVARRMAVDPATLETWRLAIDQHLERSFPDLARGVIGLCWPIRNEFDARHLAARLRAQGAITALPVVTGRGQPLVFRAWRPGVRMAMGAMDIPYPADSALVVPDTLLVPMNGFDEAGYRLGYGAGFFDRTLAAMTVPPRVIGVTYEIAAVGNIHPQPHDIPMHYVVTERGVYRRVDGRLERMPPFERQERLA